MAQLVGHSFVAYPMLLLGGQPSSRQISPFPQPGPHCKPFGQTQPSRRGDNGVPIPGAGRLPNTTGCRVGHGRKDAHLSV